MVAAWEEDAKALVQVCLPVQQRRGILDDDEVMEGSDDDEDDDGNGDDGGGEKKHKGSLVAAMTAAVAAPATACGGPPPARTVSFAAAPGEQDGNVGRCQSQGQQSLLTAFFGHRVSAERVSTPRRRLSFEGDNKSDHAKLGPPPSPVSLLFLRHSQQRSFERRGSSLERRGGSIERRTSTERRRGSLKKVLHHSASHVSPSFRLFRCLSTFILSYFVSVTPVAVPRCLGRR